MDNSKNSEMKGPEEYVALMEDWVIKAEIEIRDRVSKKSVIFPSDPTNALRLLYEFIVTFPSGFQKTKLHPREFAKLVHIFSFDDRIKNTDYWPYSKSEMRNEFVQAGLNGNPGEIFPVTYETINLIIGKDHEYTLVIFHPSIEDLKLTEPHQSLVTTRITHDGNNSTTSVSVRATGFSTISTSAHTSPSQGKAIYTVNGETYQSIENFTPEISRQSNSGSITITEQQIIMHDGSSARSKTRKDAKGILIQREVNLIKSYKQNKSLEELTAGRIFLTNFNSINYSNFTIRNSARDEERDLDLVDSNNGHTLGIQVRKCCSSPVWRSLAQRNSYSDEPNERQATEEIIESIQSKSRHYGDKSNIILLLDGGWLGFTSEVMTQIREKYFSDLSSFAFKEIWYISRISGDATRLFP